MKAGIVIAVVAVIVGMVGAPFLFLFSTPAGVMTPVSDGDGGADVIVQAIAVIRQDLEQRIEDTKRRYQYTELDLQLNDLNNWREVLSVYAVQQTTSADAQSAMLFKDAQIEELAEIYRDTHPVRAELEVIHPTTTTTVTTTTRRQPSRTTRIPTTSRTVTTRTTTTVTRSTVSSVATTTATTTTQPPRRILHIAVDGLSVAEMARKYGFNWEQQEILEALLSDELDAVWQELLADVTVNVGSPSGTIADVALSQVGNVGGEIYQKWYGFDFWVDWCAIFASWCAGQCGYIDSGICPRFEGVNSEGIPWFRSRGLWRDRSYVPKAGDYIFIDWEMDGEADHVEIVTDVVGYTVYTVGGNRGGGIGECITDTFSVGSNYIYGYGTPQYPSKE